MSALPAVTTSPFHAPRDDAPQEKNWFKISAIAFGILAAVVLASAFLCSNGTFPKEFLGGKLGIATAFTIGLCILSVAGAFFYFYQKTQKEEEATAGAPSPAALPPPT